MFSRSKNVAEIEGYLALPPRFFEIPNQDASKPPRKGVQLRISTNENIYFKNRETGEETTREETTYHDVVSYRPSDVSFAEKHLFKGSHVEVRGRIRHRSYEPADGGPKRYVSEIVLDNRRNSAAIFVCKDEKARTERLKAEAANAQNPAETKKNTPANTPANTPTNAPNTTPNSGWDAPPPAGEVGDDEIPF